MAELQVVIPYLSQFWMLEDCIQSMGDTDVPVLVVDNSKDGEAKGRQESFPSNVRVDAYRTNLGIAASWNKGLERSGAYQTLIVSQTVRFAPAELNRRVKKLPWGLDYIAEAIKKNSDEYGLTFGDQGYHCVSIGRKTVEEIGLFDENFLAYGEDDDYRHRMDLAGIKVPDIDPVKLGIHSIAFAVQKRVPEIDLGARQSRVNNWYDFKWCSSPDKYPGDYKTPFGNPDKPLSYWPEVRHG